MEEITVFENPAFGSVRTVVQNGTPWFVSVDVCKALEISNSRDAVSRLDEDEKADVIINDTSSCGVTQQRNFTIVNEPGLYALILGSRKTEAKAFKRWITHEVVPIIRKTGGYVRNADAFIDTYLPFADDSTKLMFKTTLDALQSANKMLSLEREKNDLLSAENAGQKQIIGELTPKAQYVDTILNNPGLVTITQIAKDYGMSGACMNGLLFEYKVQYKQSGQWFLYSEYHNKGYTSSRTIQISRSDGRRDVVMETKWTQKGRLFLYELLKSKGLIPQIDRVA